MSLYLNKAQFLIDQSRYELAEKELAMEINENPDNPIAHTLLAICFSQQKKFSQALSEVQTAISLAPGFSVCYYVLALVMLEQKKIETAEKNVREAIMLDPEKPEYFALLSEIKFQQKKWNDALKFSEKGLELEPENIECTNLRAMALIKLGKKEEAGLTIDSALARDPENSVTHANKGWSLLEQGSPKPAMEHFRESLRIDPESEFARDGIVEALKARNIIYRQLLKYFFWMSKLSNKGQWIFIIGLIIGIKILAEIARVSSFLAPVIYPVIILYFIFVFLVWTSEPLFNLLLRLDKFGRYSLSVDQITASNWAGFLILVTLSGIISGFLTNNITFLIAGILSGLMIIPVSATYSKESGKGRIILGFYSIVLFFLAVFTLFFAFTGNIFIYQIFLIIFLTMFILFTWIANFIR